VTLLVLSTGALPRGVGYLGGLGALGGIGGVVFMPLLPVVVWALATGIAGLMSRPAEVRATSPLGVTPSRA
jgi:hypothetical protein